MGFCAVVLGLVLIARARIGDISLGVPRGVPFVGDFFVGVVVPVCFTVSGARFFENPLSLLTTFDVVSWRGGRQDPVGDNGVD